MLDAASQLFYDNGIHAIGVDSIAAAAGVTKKTLYDRFGSKDELVRQYLQARDLRWREFLLEFVTARTDDPAEQLLVAFDALSTWSTKNNPRGCGFVNAYAELPDATHPAHIAVIEQKRWMTEFFATRARSAGLRRPASIAADLMLLYDGALVTRGMHTVNDAIRRARRIAEGVLSAARP